MHRRYRVGVYDEDIHRKLHHDHGGGIRFLHGFGVLPGTYAAVRSGGAL